MCTRLSRSLLVLLMILFVLALIAHDGPTALAEGQGAVRYLGVIGTVNGELVSKGAPYSGVVIGEPAIGPSRITAELKQVPGASVDILLLPATAMKADYALVPAALRVTISPNKEYEWMQFTTNTWDAGKKEWSTRNLTYSYFWPYKGDGEGLAATQGMTPRSWADRWFSLRIEVGEKKLSVWYAGQIVNEIDRPAGAAGPVVIALGVGDSLRNLTVQPLHENARFLPVEIQSVANARFDKSLGNTQLTVSGIPFTTTPDGQGQLNLRPVEWPEWKTDPASYYEKYDNGPIFFGDERTPFLRVPTADYCAMHLLAVADDDPGLSPNLTLDAGRYGYSDQVAHTFFFGSVPRRNKANKVARMDKVSTPNGPLFHVRVPMTEAYAQDLPSYTDILLTKEMRLARRSPDPCRFRYRPLGLPSGVKIAAITLEKSPLQMKVTSSEAGHAFVEPQTPTFTVRLQNITEQPQRFSLALKGTYLYGGGVTGNAVGMVKAGETAEVAVPLKVAKRGYYDLEVTLRGNGGGMLLQRHTSFCLLPPDTRKHRDTSPIGTWDFCGTHFTPGDPDVTGPLYVKSGMHYGMFAYTPEKRKQYGVVIGSEPVTLGNADGYAAVLKANPDLLPSGLIFHENGISGKHVSRVPDLFTDRPVYQLDETEQKSFQNLWDLAMNGATDMRKRFPDVKLALGNGTCAMKEEMLRHTFPANLFDTLGNESGTFGRLPETQPPDIVAYNATLWMDRQLLDGYGYGDKPVTQCYEIGYPSTNPGNLTQRTQADYFVRLCLHSLAWKIPYIRVGCITDMGNSYYYSNWGSTGFCNRKPEINVKPAFVAMATMTQQLDGAQYQRTLNLGSVSLYGLEFSKLDGGSVYPLWTIRGQYPVALAVDRADGWKVVDDQGNETKPPVKNGKVTVTLSPSPVYLVGAGNVTAAAPGLPTYDDKPAGKTTLLSSLAQLSDWTVEPDRNAELEFYEMLTPRRKGSFTFDEVKSFAGKTGAIKVTPRPLPAIKSTLTMPMYEVLAHNAGIPVPGTPTEIGLWVNGNSAWGRLMFELTDASGQRWISIGAQQEGDLSPWLQDWMPKELLEKTKVSGLSDWNTEDVFGLSRINFDGWRYLAFPLPGNYPGEGFHWPANSQWKWDKDGIVHYPLTFQKLIIELPEKTLHVKDYAPVPRPEIYLKDLSVSQGDTVMLMTRSRELPPASTEPR